jgi:hypothetical protein
MRFVGEKVFVECSRGTRRSALGTLAEDMLSGATKHATGETSRVTALEVRDRVNRKCGGPISRRGRLISLHSLLGGRHKRPSKTRHIVWLRGGRDGKRGCRARSSRGGDGSGQGGGRVVLELAENSFGDQPLLIAEEHVLADSRNAEGA